jgi:DNA repair exonuclease SbcCD ATPase subunit
VTRELEAEKKHLLNMRLFALWKLQEAKRNLELKEKLRQLEAQSRIAYQKHQELQAELVTSKEELNNWEMQLHQRYVPTNRPLGINIESLYSLNQTLKNEIQKIYDGDLHDFQRLENETRNVRMSNNNLESHINKLSEYLLNCTSANEALSSDIQEIKSKIKAVQDHLQSKRILAMSIRNVPYNRVQGHTATNEENSDDVKLQLPWTQPDELNNRDFLRSHKSSECSVCLNQLNNSAKGLIMVTPCGHRFHEECMKFVLQNQNICPLCRTPIDSQSLTFQTDWDNTKKLYSCFHVNLT